MKKEAGKGLASDHGLVYVKGDGDQIRASLKYIVEAVGKIRDNIRPEHRRAIGKTPFNYLLTAICDGRISASDCIKSDSAIIAAFMFFDTHSEKMKLGLEEKRMKLSDVQYIFGVTGGRDTLKVNRGPTQDWPLRRRVFAGVDELKVSIIKDRLLGLVGREDETSIEDTVKLLCLLLIGSFLFQKKGITVAWGWCEVVENFEKMCAYNWCEAILNMLLDSLLANPGRPYDVIGCTPFLVYWMAEHTTLVKPKNDIDAGSSFPRVLKWSMPDLRKGLTIDAIKSITSAQVFIQLFGL